MSSTDTNQASEDKLLGAIRTAISKDFETIYVKEFTTNWKIERLSRNLEIGVMDFDAIQALIRTEKLKLLAEVRERVIGEDVELPEVLYAHTTDGRLIDNDEVQQRVAISNAIRSDQRTELTKLEAEL